MGEDGFSIEEAYRVSSKNGPIETYKRDLNKVGTGKYWMYTGECGRLRCPSAFA